LPPFGHDALEPAAIAVVEQDLNTSTWWNKGTREPR